MNRITAAIDEYSHPWTPAISDRRGPSRVPAASKAGCSTPLKTNVRRAI
jgi:hypothetical protein